MAWSNSKIFLALVEDSLENVAAINLSSDTVKVALYNNSVTPDQTVATASSNYNTGTWGVANEVSDDPDWDLAGEVLTTQLSTRAANVYTFDGDNTPQSGTTTTLAAVFGCLVYDSTIGQGISYNYFGGSNSVTAGTFQVVWNASGIFTLTL